MASSDLFRTPTQERVRFARQHDNENDDDDEPYNNNIMNSSTNQRQNSQNITQSSMNDTTQSSNNNEASMTNLNVLPSARQQQPQSKPRAAVNIGQIRKEIDETAEQIRVQFLDFLDQ